METEVIGLDIPVKEVYPSYVERYFTPRYVLDTASKVGEDICVLFHSNRVCVVTLAPSHPVLSQKKKVLSVDFQTSDSINRMDNKVSGKGKHGGQILNKMSPLCKLKCADGSSYVVRSSVPGKLLEINDRLLKNPGLITEKPSSDGYIAIVLPKGLQSDKLRDYLPTPEKYQEAIAERNKTNDAGSNGETSEAVTEN